jgi:hypothetical protein
MADTKTCDVCGTDSHQSVLVHTESEGVQKSYCMRCFHALLHGMSPAQLKERWDAFLKQQGQGPQGQG